MKQELKEQKFKILVEVDCDPRVHAQEEIGNQIFVEILGEEYREPDYTFFGCWTWKDVWCNSEQQGKIKELLTTLYYKDVVRYAGWGKVCNEG